MTEKKTTAHRLTEALRSIRNFAEKNPLRKTNHASVKIQTFKEKVKSVAPSRAETGAMYFGDDWSGVFIRGDNACYDAFVLERVLNRLEQPGMENSERINISVLRGLVNTLRSCMEGGGERPAAQRMKPFADCFAPEGKRHLTHAELTQKLQNMHRRAQKAEGKYQRHKWEIEWRQASINRYWSKIQQQDAEIRTLKARLSEYEEAARDAKAEEIISGD